MAYLPDVTTPHVLALAARSSRAAKASSCCRSCSPSAARCGTPTCAAPSSGSGTTTPAGHFVRAAVEGVAFQLATILDGLESVEPVTSIRATGGAFRSALWREVLAGVLDRPLTVTAGAEGSALGAAALGLHAIGAAPVPGAARCRAARPATCSSPGPTTTTRSWPSPASARHTTSPASSAAQTARATWRQQRTSWQDRAAQWTDNRRQPTGNKRQLVVGADLRALTRASPQPRCSGPQRSSAP